MIRFHIQEDVPLVEGALFYRSADHAFDFEPRSRAEVRERAGAVGVTSLSIGTVQLEVGIETGVVLYPWGYHPRATWVAHPLSPTAARRAGLRVVSDKALEPGVSIDITGESPWLTQHDPKSGWVRLSRVGAISDAEERVEFSTGAVACIVNGAIAALWLHPRVEDAARSA